MDLPFHLMVELDELDVRRDSVGNICPDCGTTVR